MKLTYDESIIMGARPHPIYRGYTSITPLDEIEPGDLIAHLDLTYEVTRVSTTLIYFDRGGTTYCVSASESFLKRR